MPVNLFQLAVANGASLESRFGDLKSTLEPAAAAQLERFAQQVERDGRVSKNMRVGDLLGFLDSGRLENTYDWARQRAEESGRPLGDILRDRLGPYYERRHAFDQHFQDGERFHYGALNAGGAGPTATYGECCLVLADQFASAHPDIAYLRSDSLDTYMLPGPEVDEAAVARDAAPHSHRHCLAGVERAARVPGTPEARWPRMLCSDEGYVEAVFVAETMPSHLGSVRMLRSDYELFCYFAYQDLRYGNRLERTLIDAFVRVKRLLRQHSIPLEVTEDG